MYRSAAVDRFETVAGTSRQARERSVGSAHREPLRARLDRELDPVVGAHEGRDERARRPVPEPLGAVELDDPAPVHDRDPVGHHHGLLAIVGDVERRDAEPALEAADLVRELEADPRIEVRERFVEEQQTRFDREGPAECQALRLAAGELPDVALAQALEAEQGQHLAHTRGDRLLGPAAHPEAVADVPGRRHVRPERIRLEDERGVTPFRRQVLDGPAVHHDPPGTNRREAADRAQQGGLAAARGAEQRNEFASIDGEIEFVEDRRGAEDDAQSLDREIGSRAPVPVDCRARTGS